jgi:hypothetical protein
MLSYFLFRYVTSGVGLEIPVKNKLLTFVEISGETLDVISAQVMKAVASYDLDTKVVIYR